MGLFDDLPAYDEWNAPARRSRGLGFDSAVQHVLRTEGGYVADDAGKGPSNFGINKGANPDVNVGGLTPERATALYKTRYWDTIDADNLPPDLQLAAFDASVNQGPARARQWIKESGGDPQRFLALRRQHYDSLVRSNPEKFGKYAKGWANRVNDIEAQLGHGGVPMEGGMFAGLSTVGLTGSVPEAPKEVPKATWWDTAKDTVHQGAASFVVDAPRMGGQIIRRLAPDGSVGDEFGRSIVEAADARAKDWEPAKRERTLAQEALVTGVRGIGSMTPTIAASIGPWGAVTGPAMALATFGPSAAQDTEDKLRKQGVPDDQAFRAGLWSGVIEGGGEAIGAAVARPMLGLTRSLLGGAKGGVSGVVKGMTDTRVLAPFAKGFALNMPVQAGTEAAQGIGVELVERAYGAKPEDLTQIARDNAVAGAGLTALLAPLGLGGHVRRARNAEEFKQVLEDPTLPDAVRARAWDTVAAEAKRQGVSAQNIDAWLDQQFEAADARQAGIDADARQTQVRQAASETLDGYDARAAADKALSNPPARPGYEQDWERMLSEETGSTVHDEHGLETPETQFDRLLRQTGTTREEQVGVQAAQDVAPQAPQAPPPAPPPTPAQQVAKREADRNKRALTEFGIHKTGALATFAELEDALVDGVIDEDQFNTAAGMLAGGAVRLAEVRSMLATLKNRAQIAQAEAAKPEPMKGGTPPDVEAIMADLDPGQVQIEEPAPRAGQKPEVEVAPVPAQQGVQPVELDVRDGETPGMALVRQMDEKRRADNKAAGKKRVRGMSKEAKVYVMLALGYNADGTVPAGGAQPGHRTLNEIAGLANAHFGKTVGLTAVDNALKKYGVPSKAIQEASSTTATMRSEELAPGTGEQAVESTEDTVARAQAEERAREFWGYTDASESATFDDLTDREQEAYIKAVEDFNSVAANPEATPEAKRKAGEAFNQLESRLNGKYAKPLDGAGPEETAAQKVLNTRRNDWASEESLFGIPELNAGHVAAVASRVPAVTKDVGDIKSRSEGVFGLTPAHKLPTVRKAVYAALLTVRNHPLLKLMTGRALGGVKSISVFEAANDVQHRINGVFFPRSNVLALNMEPLQYASDNPDAAQPTMAVATTLAHELGHVADQMAGEAIGLNDYASAAEGSPLHVGMTAAKDGTVSFELGPVAQELFKAWQDGKLPAYGEVFPALQEQMARAATGKTFTADQQKAAKADAREASKETWPRMVEAMQANPKLFKAIAPQAYALANAALKARSDTQMGHILAGHTAVKGVNGGQATNPRTVPGNDARVSRGQDLGGPASGRAAGRDARSVPEQVRPADQAGRAGAQPDAQARGRAAGVEPAQRDGASGTADAAVPRVAGHRGDDRLEEAARQLNFGQSGRARFSEANHRPTVVNWAKGFFGDRVAPNGRPAWQNFKSAIGNYGDFNPGSEEIAKQAVPEEAAFQRVAPAQAVQRSNESMSWAMQAAKDAKDWAFQRIAYTTDLVASAKKYLPSAQKYLDLVRQAQADRVKSEMDITTIVGDFYRLKSNERGTGPGTVNGFLKDSTLEKKWGFKPSWQRDAQVDPAMEAKFKALSPQAQAVVKRVLQHGHDSIVQLRKAALESIAHESDALIKTARDRGDLAGVRRAENAKLRSVRQFEGLVELDTRMPYAPLKRFGNEVVIYRSNELAAQEAIAKDKTADEDARAAARKKIAEMRQDGKHYGVWFRESRSAARKLAEQVRRETGGRGEVENFAREAPQYGAMGDMMTAFHRLQEMVDSSTDKDLREKSSGALRQLMTDLHLSLLSEQSVRQSGRRREGVMGADEDMMRSFESHGRALANFTSSIHNTREIQQQIAAMRKEARDNRNPGTTEERQDYFNELLRRHMMNLDYQPPSGWSTFTNKAMASTSAWMLLTSISYHVSNATQPWAMSLPLMAAKHGYGRSSAALIQAYRDVAPALRDGRISKSDFSKLPEDVRDVVTRLADEGVIMISLETEMGRWAQTDNPTLAGASRTAAKVTHTMTKLAQTTEAVNRLATAVAAVRLEQKRGSDGFDFARQIIDQSHGEYAGWNAPRFMRGSTMRMVTQFRKFQLIQASLWVRLAHDSFKGATAEERKVARYALTYSLAHMGALGGLVGMPAFSLFAFLLNTAMGFTGSDEPWDTEDEIAKMFGDGVLGRLMARGAPFAFMNTDTSGRWGAGQAFSMLPYTDLKATRDGWSSVVTSSLGPFVGGVMPRAVEGLGLIKDGQMWKGMEGMMPKGVTDFSKAIRQETQGVTNKRGDVLLTPAELNIMDGILQGIGFPTATTTERGRNAGVKFEVEEFYKARAAKLKREFMAARKAGDQAAMAEVRQAWMNTQAARRNLGLQAQPLSQLVQAAAQQQKRERDTVGGIQYNKSNRRFVESLVNRGGQDDAPVDDEEDADDEEGED